ncbi:hypothetical protein [Massilia sp. S19_KUP03_FR1]|uniref:hypothetical protein n=1 Tax=Massilia sp. S19_KUP03_FR1 TaxID=3025503 RepID=UPI002FCD9349
MSRLMPHCAITIFSLLACTTWPCSSAQSAEAKESDVFGHWRFAAVLDSSDISSLDDREAQQLVGRIFTVNKDHVKFGKRDCGPPELEAELVEPAWYLREKAHASSELLRLPSPVTVVKLGCTIAFIKNPQNIVVHWKGWFFDAKRVP